MRNYLWITCGIFPTLKSYDCLYGNVGSSGYVPFYFNVRPHLTFSFCFGPLISRKGYVSWPTFMLTKTLKEETQSEKWIGYGLLCLNWRFSLEFWFSWPSRYSMLGFIGLNLLIFFIPLWLLIVWLGLGLRTPSNASI